MRIATRYRGECRMRTKNMVFCGSVLCVAWLSLAIAAPRAISHFAQGTEESVPAFHHEPPQGTLPGTVSPTEFSDVVVQNAYILAARVKRILYQQPCYCHCDRSQGHKSLLDCFGSKHGGGWEVCMQKPFNQYDQPHQEKMPPRSARESSAGNGSKSI